MSDETGDNFDLKNYKTSVMQKHINELLQAGYTDVTRNSGVGSTILFHPATKRIAKFNQDPAYDKFIEFVRQHPQPCFPKVDLHERPAGQFDDPDFPYANDRYSLTIMELLTPIELDVESQIVSWVGNASKRCITTVVDSDVRRVAASG